MHVYRLSEPIDDFDGLTPLNEWLDGDAERLAWALQAVLALAQAAPAVGWRGDMRHLPLVGHLPTSPFVARYLIIKQDNNGDTFLISQADPAELLDHAAADEVTAEIAARIRVAPTSWKKAAPFKPETRSG